APRSTLFPSRRSSDLDEQPGYSYARYASPTVVAFEEAVAALEDAPAAVAFASGMAAIHAAVRFFAPETASVLFASNDCYGGTFRSEEHTSELQSRSDL